MTVFIRNFDLRSGLVGFVSAALILLGLSELSFGQQPRPFEMLVVGDSHISGQGLREKDKFYSLVKEWLQNEIFDTAKKVNLKVKAHAGSRITMHPEELRAMQKTGDDINTFHYVEANISSPTIKAQIDFARAEYDDPASVDLVMLSGCITDVLVADIINPFYPEKKLRERIKRFCGGSMSELLAHTSNAFPNAAIIVVGYFPIASVKGDIKAMARYFLRIISFPPKLHFFFTNPVSRAILKIFRKRIAKRSRVWLRESNAEIRAAIAAASQANGRRKILFVESPFSDEFSYGTKGSMLWEIGRNHRPNDDTYAERKVGCAKVFSEMKYKHYGRLSTRMCELSSVAHPNIEGSKAYAEAVKKVIQENSLIEHKNLGNL